MALVESISDTIRSIGAAKARGLERQAEISGGLLSTLGHLATSGIGQYQQAKQQEDTDKLRKLQLAEGTFDLQRKQQLAGYEDQANQLISAAFDTTEDGSRVINRDKLQAGFAAANIPVELQAKHLRTLDEVDASMKKFATDRREAIASLANGVLQMAGDGPVTNDLMNQGITYAKANGLIENDKQVYPIYSAMAEGADLRPMLDNLRRSAPSGKYSNKVMTFKEGETLGVVSPEGKVTTTYTGQPKPPTGPELDAAVRAAYGVPEAERTPAQQAVIRGYEAEQAVKRPPKEPTSPEVQYLEAIKKGDQAEAGRILTAIRATANAKKDPASAALAGELAGLRKDEAIQRLEKLRKENAPVDVAPDVQTTVSGRKYIDLSKYGASERDKARDAANKMGIVPVSKEDADTIDNIDTARLNQEKIRQQVAELLPKGPAGRLGAAVSVPLSKLFQTNDQIAAFGSLRNAAIQAMRATAGSKGLRINRSEIDLAIENDIPKLTDTVGAATQKMKNILMLLDSAEAPILIRDRSALTTAPAPAPANTLTPGLQGLGNR